MVCDTDDVVNGPEARPIGWDTVRWHQVEQEVRRLRQRIFTASQAGDHKKVRNLQRLMLRSRSNALVAVRRVTERNAGRKTAGVDGKVVVTADEKAEMVDWLQHRAAPWSPQPVQRVYVPQEQRAPSPARDSGHRRQMPPGSDGQRAGTRMGGPVRTQIVRISTGTGAATTRSWPSTRRQATPTPSAYGYLTPTWRRRSTILITTTSPVAGSLSRTGTGAPVAEVRRARGWSVRPHRRGLPSGWSAGTQVCLCFLWWWISRSGGP